MDWDFLRPYFELIKFQNRNPLPQTKAAFKALVEAIVPNTPDISVQHGSIQSMGTLDLRCDEYLRWTLDHYFLLITAITDINIYLANATAELLNIGARELINAGRNTKPVNSDILPEEGPFAALEPTDRFRAVTFLEQGNVDLTSLPVPYRNNPDFMLTVTGVITLLTTFGFYSEWSGYGTTRLETPNLRKLEQFPSGWQQVGYPGPARGYHAFRGYLTIKND